MGAVLCMFLGYHQRLVLKQSGTFLGSFKLFNLLHLALEQFFK